MQRVMIKIKDLSIKYDKKLVLDKVSLEINKSLTILGNNGSGKSSFAKSLVDIIQYEGKIELFGKDIKSFEKKDLAKQISYTPTKLDVFEEFSTLFDFVLFGAYPYKDIFSDFSKTQKENVKEILKNLEIFHLKDSLVHNLSSGEASLALLAFMLASKSKIIILDEPTANLDPKNSLKIAKIIKKLLSTHTIILITHDIDLAKYINNDILFIKEKKITFYNKENFFDDKTLSSLYEVDFKDKRVLYE